LTIFKKGNNQTDGLSEEMIEKYTGLTPEEIRTL
jgi:hypothetical protein